MKTYITNVEYGYDYQYSVTTHSPFYIKINLEGHQPGNNALSDLLNRQTSEVELLFGDELKEYKKINENKEKIKNILGEDFNMEINLKEIVEKVLDERAAKELHATNYEIECLKQKIRELEADNAKLTAYNTDLSTSFKQLVNDQEEALDYIETLECELSGYEANEAADINDDITDYLNYIDRYCECDECEEVCGSLCRCCEDEAMQWAPAIDHIHFCEEKGKEKTIVLFKDGTKVIMPLHEGDIFDLNVGVALCVAERMYGGKTKFHKMVKKIAGVKNEKKRTINVEIPKKANAATIVKAALDTFTENPNATEADVNAAVKAKATSKKK